MLKKTTLLSIATAAAVITTSVGTFAAYDTVTAEATAGNVTFRKPVTIQAAELTMSPEEDSLGTAPSATGTVTFTVTDEESLASSLGLEIAVADNGATGLSASDFDFNVTDSSDGANSGCTGGGTSWTDSDLTGTNQYTVTATLKAESASKLNSAAGDVKITVTGTLS